MDNHQTNSRVKEIRLTKTQDSQILLSKTIIMSKVSARSKYKLDQPFSKHHSETPFLNNITGKKGNSRIRPSLLF